MKNLRYEHFTEVKVTSGGAVVSGSVAVIGSLIGVAKTAVAASGEDLMYSVKGVFALTKKSAITPAKGTQVFWDAGNSRISDTASEGVPAGVVVQTPASGDATVLVAINEQVPGANVAFSAGANLVGVDGAGSNAAPLAGTETRLDALETAVLAILTSLKGAGGMKSS